jgi:hypothetical protein
LAVSPDKGDIFNAIVGQPSTTRRVVGIDRIDPTDPATKQWIDATLTPEEVLDGELPTLHDALKRAKVSPERLGFQRADASSRREVDAVLAAEGGQFNIVSSVASWYQGTADQRKRKFVNITQRLVQPGGVSYFLDFAKRVNGGKTYLAPLRQWVEMNLFVCYENRLYRAGSFTDGRAHTLRISHELLELARGGPYEQEVQELAAKPKG